MRHYMAFTKAFQIQCRVIIFYLHVSTLLDCSSSGDQFLVVSGCGFTCGTNDLEAAGKDLFLHKAYSSISGSLGTPSHDPSS